MAEFTRASALTVGYARAAEADRRDQHPKDFASRAGFVHTGD
jgi:hypothetical protein